MTLEEKLYDEYIWTTEPTMDAEEVFESIDKMIEIADEFAISFSEWHINTLLSSKYIEIKTMKELLEIYKKEKGL